MNKLRSSQVLAPAAPDQRSRDRVLQAISQQGPITTTALAAALGLSDTAVRRHVDNLVEAGLIEPHEAGAAPRRRGRPARAYVVSDAGHRSLTSGYDLLAGDALRYLSETLGSEAVDDFARRRIDVWEQRYAAQLDPRSTPVEKAETLAAALTRDGFDASLRRVGGPQTPAALSGIQLCQGHCPVQGVATAFPQLCEAEAAAFSRLLGVHVQRLATLAHGDHVCTTFVPTPTTTPTATEAS